MSAQAVKMPCMVAVETHKPTVKECDRHLRVWWRRMSDPHYDRAECRHQLDYWLDVRLSLTRDR